MVVGPTILRGPYYSMANNYSRTLAAKRCYDLPPPRIDIRATVASLQFDPLE